MRLARWGVVLASCLLATAPALAQGRSAAARPMLEVSGSLAWAGGIDFGTKTADITRNVVPGTPYPIFSTASEIGRVAGFEGRVAVHLTRTIAVEGVFGYAAPTLRTRVSADIENAPAVTATEKLAEYRLEGSGVVHLSRWRVGRIEPFVLAGAGYLRQWHEGQQVDATGHSFHAGGGVIIPIVTGRHGLLRGAAFRVDGRLVGRSGGIDLDTKQPVRVLPVIAAGLSARF
jgi:hypothetical protein